MKKHLLFSLIFSFAFLSFGKPLKRNPARKGKDYALFFAVEQYDDTRRLQKLKYPIQNARDIKATLENIYGFQCELVENPTYDQIERKLNEYAENFRNRRFDADGQLLIFFSGHGERVSGNGFFLPKDTRMDDLRRTAFSYALWRNDIDQIPCKHILVAIDACKSGSFDPATEGMKSGGDDLFGKRGNEPSARDILLQEAAQYKTRLFASSGALDVATPDKSEFAYQFLAALRSRGNLGATNDNILTIKELSTFFENASPKPMAGRFGFNEPQSNFLFIADSPPSGAVNTEGVTNSQKDIDMWQRAKNQNTISSYQEYIRLNPNGDFVNQAKKAIENLEQQNDVKAWDEAKKANSPEEYQSFISKYSNSLYVTVAQERLNSFFKKGNYAISSGHPPGVNCITAPMLYSNDLPYENLLPVINVPFSSQGCGSIENAHLFNFIPTTKNITLKIGTKMCTSGPFGNGSGIQIRVYETTDCISFKSVYCGANEPILPIKTNEIKITNLIPGDLYILMIDGQRNDICNYTIDISEGSITKSPKISDRSPFEPDMVSVQGGTFQMGDVLDDKEYSYEKPVHEVALNSFQIGKYEVSQAEWVAIMRTNPSNFKGDNLPVENVSWDDVQEYLKKLNQKTGKKYRLPTEAEWEYAAREGGKNIRFGNGKNTADPSEMNFDASASYKKTYSVIGEYRAKTVAVNSFSPNALGLYNMSGNVWEWCSDWFSSYDSVAVNNPTGVATMSYRVYRGGGWSLSPQDCRVSYRAYGSPMGRYGSLGFRVAISPP
jgi:formylglycine-generating enzyme required for sulfatase activity/uncharacterized caspase-like protein